MIQLAKKDSKKKEICCLKCGEGNKLNFYSSRNEQYGFFGYIPWCKNCIEEIYAKYFIKYSSVRVAIIYMCRVINIPFYSVLCSSAIKEAENRNWTVRQAYIKQILGLGVHNRYSTEFDGGECAYIIENPNIDMCLNTNLKNDNETTTTEGENNNIINTNTESLSNQDEEIKKDIIRLVGYDPFDGYSVFDQKFLYNELISYLDEDTLDDSFKLSQVVQIVNNNNQIRNIDLVIAQSTSNVADIMQNETKINALTKSKASIVSNTDKIAKENGISVKNRGDKRAGKSTLTHIMKEYRELGFKNAEQDYYDQKKAYGMKLVADISNKSILEQLQFDENDVHDMFFMQRQLVQELQEKILDVEEENRQLHEKISKDRTIDIGE